MTTDTSSTPTPQDAIPTGSAELDRALGCGGYPRGRIVEIFGPEASGKTTLALHAIAEAQAQGGICAFVDAEHVLDLDYARALGVDLERLLVSQPDDGEQAFDVVEALVRSCVVDLVVVDSVAALVPRDAGVGEVGLHARMMSKAMRRITAVVDKSKSTLIFINQVRSRPGATFGPSEVTTGGNALKYYASVRLDVRCVGALKRGGDAYGNRTRVKVVKNKLAPPFRQVEFDLVFGRGIRDAAEGVPNPAESRSLKSGADDREGMTPDTPIALVQPEGVPDSAESRDASTPPRRDPAGRPMTRFLLRCGGVFELPHHESACRAVVTVPTEVFSKGLAEASAEIERVEGWVIAQDRNTGIVEPRCPWCASGVING